MSKQPVVNLVAQKKTDKKSNILGIKQQRDPREKASEPVGTAISRVSAMTIKSKESETIRSTFKNFLAHDYKPWDNNIRTNFLRLSATERKERGIPADVDLVSYWGTSMPEKDKRQFIIDSIVNIQTFSNFYWLKKFFSKVEMTARLQDKFMRECLEATSMTLDTFYNQWITIPENKLSMAMTKIAIEKKLADNVSVRDLIGKSISDDIIEFAQKAGVEPYIPQLEKEEEEKKDNDNNILSDSEYEYVDDGNVIEQKDILDEIDFEEGGNEEEFESKKDLSILNSMKVLSVPKKKKKKGESMLDLKQARQKTALEIFYEKDEQELKEKEKELKKIEKAIKNKLKENSIVKAPKRYFANYDETLNRILERTPPDQFETMKRIYKEQILKPYFDVYVMLRKIYLSAIKQADNLNYDHRYLDATVGSVIVDLTRQIDNYDDIVAITVLQMNNDYMKGMYPELFDDQASRIWNQVNIIVHHSKLKISSRDDKVKKEIIETPESIARKENIAKMKETLNKFGLNSGKMYDIAITLDSTPVASTQCSKCGKLIKLGVDTSLIENSVNWCPYCTDIILMYRTENGNKPFKIRQTFFAIIDLLSKLNKDDERQEIIDTIGYIYPIMGKELLYFKTKHALIQILLKYLDLPTNHSDKLGIVMTTRRIIALTAFKKRYLQYRDFQLEKDENKLVDVSVLVRSIPLSTDLSSVYKEKNLDVLKEKLRGLMSPQIEEKVVEEVVEDNKKSVPFSQKDRVISELSKYNLHDSIQLDIISLEELTILLRMIRSIEKDDPETNFSEMTLPEIRSKLKNIKHKPQEIKQSITESTLNQPVDNDFIYLCKTQIQNFLHQHGIDLYIYDKTSLFMEDAFKPFLNSTKGQLMKAVATLICILNIPELFNRLKAGIVSSKFLLTEDLFNTYTDGFSVKKRNELEKCIEHNMKNVLEQEFDADNIRPLESISTKNIDYRCGDKVIPRERVILYKNNDDVISCYDVDELISSFRLGLTTDNNGEPFGEDFVRKFFIVDEKGEEYLIDDLKISVNGNFINPSTNQPFTNQEEIKQKVASRKEFQNIVNTMIIHCKNYNEALNIPYDQMVFYRDNNDDLYCFSKNNLSRLALENKNVYYGITLPAELLEPYKPKTILIKEGIYSDNDKSIFVRVKNFFNKTVEQKDPEPIDIYPSSISTIPTGKKKQKSSSVITRTNPTTHHSLFSKPEIKLPPPLPRQIISNGEEIKLPPPLPIQELIVEEEEMNSDSEDFIKSIISEDTDADKIKRVISKDTDVNKIDMGFISSSKCDTCGSDNPKNTSYKSVSGPGSKHVSFCSAECMEKFHFPKYRN